MIRVTASLLAAAILTGGATAHATEPAPLPTEATASTVPNLPTTCPTRFIGRKVTAIRTAGLDQTKPYVVKRALFHRRGQPFSCRRYRRTKKRLQSLDIFAVVRLRATADGPGVALTWRFVELPRYLLYPAVRRSDLYGWLAGPAASFFNFLGRDIRLEAFLRTALYPDPFVATELLIEASSPWIGRDIPVEYEFSLLRNQAFNAVKQFNETSWNGALSLFHRMTWRFRLIYQLELYQVDADPAHPTFDVVSNPSPVPIVLDPAGDMVLGLGAGLLWDSRDRRVNPHRGMWQEVRAAQYGGVLGGPANYRYYLVDHRSWWSHRWSPSQLTILHLSGLLRLRPGRMGVYDYFVLGGPNSLRSYEQNSELYAQSEILGTVELRHELFDRMPASVFGLNLYYGLQLVAGADIALLWRAHDPLSGPPRRHGAVYAGVHVLLPGVDRVRLELGVHRGVGGRLEPRFTVGLFEKSATQRLRQR